MFQLLLILILFVMALAYLGMIIYKSFKGEKSCEGDCKCAADKPKIYKGEFTTG